MQISRLPTTQRRIDTNSGAVLQRLLGAALQRVLGSATGARRLCHTLTCARETFDARAEIGVADCEENGIMFVEDGWIFSDTVLPDGRRQIISFLLPGDFIVPDSLSSLEPGLTLEAATPTKLWRLSPNRFGRADDAGAILDDVAEEVRAAEHALFARRIVDLGRCTALERVARLILELWIRLDTAGLAKRGRRFDLRVSQELIADAIGLSVVHVNRTLRRLREEGILSVRGGTAVIHDRPALLQAAGVESEDEIVSHNGQTHARLVA